LPRFERKIQELQSQFGLTVDPKAKIWQISVGEQQRVETSKTLYRGANVLIFDKPTTVWHPWRSRPDRDDTRSGRPGEIDCFYQPQIARSRGCRRPDHGAAQRAGDRRGLPMAGRTRRELAQLMVGRDVVFEVAKEATPPGEAVWKAPTAESNQRQGNPRTAWVVAGDLCR
jgi:simple sugar transport system ATP-binding protein